MIQITERGGASSALRACGRLVRRGDRHPRRAGNGCADSGVVEVHGVSLRRRGRVWLVDLQDVVPVQCICSRLLQTPVHASSADAIGSWRANRAGRRLAFRRRSAARLR